MPYRSPRPCKNKQCNGLSTTKSQYCEVCVHLGYETAESREYDKYRPRKDIYNTTKWKEFSREYKRIHPICEVCNINPSEETHHISYNPVVVQALCKSCHTKTRKETMITEDEEVFRL